MFYFESSSFIHSDRYSRPFALLSTVDFHGAPTVHEMAGEDDSGDGEFRRETGHRITCNRNNDGAARSQQFQRCPGDRQRDGIGFGV